MLGGATLIFLDEIGATVGTVTSGKLIALRNSSTNPLTSLECSGLEITYSATGLMKAEYWEAIRSENLCSKLIFNF
jgi:hypothetical protein